MQIDKLDKAVLIASIKDGQSKEEVEVSSVDNKELIIRAGDIANVLFKFMFESVYINPGSIISFREGKTKGLGKVVRVLDKKTGFSPKNH